MRTPLYYGQIPMFRQNSHTFPLKKPSIIRTLSNTDNGQRTQNLSPLEQIHTNLTSLLQTLRDKGVDNLRYMYHFLSAVTQTLTLHESAIPQVPEHVLGEVFRFVPKFVCTACI